MARSLVTAVGGILGSIVAASGLAAQDAGRPTHDMVRVGSFEIDRHEVTIAQFSAFATASGTTTKAEREGGGFQYLGGWQRKSGWTWAQPHGDGPTVRELPAVHVTWHEAKAYCAWAGLRLPTDAEWVEAAYTERRPAPPEPFVAKRTYPFPTGDGPDAANQTDASRAAFSSPPLAVETRDGRPIGPVRVGSTAPGVNGLLDMGGNVWEWVDLDVGGQKRTRGGSWWYGPAQMKADALYEKAPDFPAVYIGFRCARS